MKVEQLMKRSVKTCTVLDSLNTAAQIMWESDCGCVPVVDDGHVVAMLTDRDICMAAYTQGAPLGAIAVPSAMSQQIYSCKSDDSVAAAEDIMRAKKVRRLPVVDTEGTLVGILSLHDIAREMTAERRGKGKREVTPETVSATLAAVCEPRGCTSLAAAA
jgi:CBS domain-containing protein